MIPDWMLIAATQRILSGGELDSTRKLTAWLQDHVTEFTPALSQRIRYHVQETLQRDSWHPELTPETRVCWERFLACITPKSTASSL